MKQEVVSVAGGRGGCVWMGMVRGWGEGMGGLDGDGRLKAD